MHFREAIVADNLGEPRNEGGRVVATVDILLGELHRNFYLRDRPQLAEISHGGPVNRRLLVDLFADGIQQFLLRPIGQRRNGCRIRLGCGCEAPLGRANLRAGMPEQQHQEFVPQAQTFQPQQVAAQIHAGMQVYIHRIARERAQEQPGCANRQGLACAFQGQPIGQGFRKHHRDIRKDVALPDRLTQAPNGRRFIVPGALAQGDR